MGWKEFKFNKSSLIRRSPSNGKSTQMSRLKYCHTGWKKFTFPNYVTFGIKLSSCITKITIVSINPKLKLQKNKFKFKKSNHTQVYKLFTVDRWLKTANVYQKLFGKSWGIVYSKVSITLSSVRELSKIKALNCKMTSWDHTWFS